MLDIFVGEKATNTIPSQNTRSSYEKSNSLVLNFQIYTNHEAQRASNQTKSTSQSKIKRHLHWSHMTCVSTFVSLSIVKWCQLVTIFFWRFEYHLSELCSRIGTDECEHLQRVLLRSDYRWSVEKFFVDIRFSVIPEETGNNHCLQEVVLYQILFLS